MNALRRAGLLALTLLLFAGTLSCGADQGPGVAAAVEIVSGDGQSAEVGSTLPEPVVVRVVDTDGVPISGTGVTWEVTAGGGSVTAQIRTGPRGHASASWILGDAVGEQSLRVSAEGAEAITVTATGLAPEGGG